MNCCLLFWIYLFGRLFHILGDKRVQRDIGWSREWEYQVDSARGGAGRLVEHANKQTGCRL